MNFAETYRKLLKQRLDTHDEALTFEEPFIKDAVHLFAKNIPEAISYLNNECTEEEYGFISEIIDDIAADSKSLKLIQAYAALAEKYPKETEDYNISSFINSAMSIAQSWQDAELDVDDEQKNIRSEIR